MVLKQPLLALLSQRLSLEMPWPKPEVTILQKRHSQKLDVDPACSGLRIRKHFPQDRSLWPVVFGFLENSPWKQQRSGLIRLNCSPEECVPLAASAHFPELSLGKTACPNFPLRVGSWKSSRCLFSR